MGQQEFQPAFDVLSAAVTEGTTLACEWPMPIAPDNNTFRESRFGVEPEMVAKIARVRLRDDTVPGGKRAARVYEVAVSYAGRTYAEGKKIKARDGVRALIAIVKYGLFSR